MFERRQFFLLTFIGSFFAVGCVGFAQDLVQVTESGVSQKSNPAKARQEIISQVTRTVSMRYMSEVLGEKKMARESTAIRRIIDNSGKFITFIKPLQLKSTPNGFQMDVELRLSLRSLHEVLLQEGLLYEMSGPLNILPLIGIVDRIRAVSFHWWAAPVTANKKFLAHNLDLVRQILSETFSKNGFSVTDPIGGKLYDLLPPHYRQDQLRLEDRLFIGDFFKDQMILDGEIIFESLEKTHRLRVKISALPTRNPRILASSSQLIELPQDDQALRQQLKTTMIWIAQDLASQILDAWKRGVYGTTPVKILIQGNHRYEQREELKNLIRRVPSVRGIRERLFTPQNFTLEMDVVGNASELGVKMRSTPFSGYKVTVDDVQASTVVVSVQRIKGQDNR